MNVDSTESDPHIGDEDDDYGDESDDDDEQTTGKNTIQSL